MTLKKSPGLRMKYEALRWLRLDQRCYLIATEVGNYSADVLGINEEKMIEIEVKVSFEDFKADFRKTKHHFYSGVFSESTSQWVPTHFYFVVPKEIVEEVKKFLEKQEIKTPKAGSYGVIQLEDWRVIKRAKWIHKNKPTNRVKNVLALRMGSELIRFHEAWL